MNHISTPMTPQYDVKIERIPTKSVLRKQGTVDTESRTEPPSIEMTSSLSNHSNTATTTLGSNLSSTRSHTRSATGSATTMTTSSAGSKSKDLVRVRSTSSGSSQTEPMRLIFVDDLLLSAFIKHLIKDFSLEVLLSFIEVQQFKAYLAETFDLSVSGQLMWRFADCVPKSDIVHRGEGKDLDAFKEMAHKLYMKYIRISAEFQINISYLHRERLTTMMWNKEQWMRTGVTVEELSCLFDEAMKEMVQLLGYARRRFDVKHKIVRQ